MPKTSIPKMKDLGLGCNWILPHILEMSLIHGITHGKAWDEKYTRRFHQVLYIVEEMVCVLRPFQDLRYAFARQVGIKVHKILKGWKKGPSPTLEIMIFKKKNS